MAVIPATTGGKTYFVCEDLELCALGWNKKLFREAGYLSGEEIAAIEAEVEQEIQEACKFAVDSPYPDESDLMKGIFCE